MGSPCPAVPIVVTWRDLLEDVVEMQWAIACAVWVAGDLIAPCFELRLRHRCAVKFCPMGSLLFDEVVYGGDSSSSSIGSSSLHGVIVTGCRAAQTVSGV